MQTSRQSVRRFRAQDGFVLPMVLVMLAVGALMLIPALQFSWASLKASEVTEWKASEIFDADSGVDEAVRWLQFDGQVGSGWTEVAAGEWQRSALQHELNGSDVDVAIEEVATQTYKVTSYAESETGTSTEVVAYVVLDYSDFSFLLDSAITSNGSVTLMPGDVVNGDVRLPDVDDLENKGDIYGDIKTDETEGGAIVWPEAEFLMDYYMNSLEDEAPYTTYPADTQLDIGGTSEADPFLVGPCLAEGDLQFKGTGWVRLEGTVYVTGSLEFDPTPSITLDLNQQTIFAVGSIDDNSVTMGTDITILNSGCIIGVYDVDFQPQIAAVPEGEEEPFVLIMSVLGTTTLNPVSDFYGAVVGNVDIQMQPGVTLNWVDPEGKGINFPVGEGTVGQPGTTITIPSYVIS